jgi:23S rRNA maturation-related 3'-5' exoribonuclease YhaM
MKSQYAIELVEGMHVDAVFAMRAKELRSTRAGEAYLALELADRTGLIPAVFFRPSADSISLPTGSVVEVRGTVTTYRGTRRVSIDSVRPAGSYERADLLAAPDERACLRAEGARGRSACAHVPRTAAGRLR